MQPHGVRTGRSGVLATSPLGRPDPNADAYKPKAECWGDWQDAPLLVAAVAEDPPRYGARLALASHPHMHGSGGFTGLISGRFHAFG